MERDKKPKSHFKKWVPFLFAMPVGVVGYFVGGRLAEDFPNGQLLKWLGEPKGDQFDTLGWVALFFAAVWVMICLLSAFLFFVARFNKVAGDTMGINQMIGSGQAGRRSALPLTLFYLANAGSIILLAIAEFLQLSNAHAVWVSLGGFAMALIMVVTGLRLWVVLDELVRIIWVEALAISGLIFLLVASAYGTAVAAGTARSISLFEAIIAFHIFYTIVYVVITAMRAPALLGILDDEEAA